MQAEYFSAVHVRRGVRAKTEPVSVRGTAWSGVRRTRRPPAPHLLPSHPPHLMSKLLQLELQPAAAE